MRTSEEDILRECYVTDYIDKIYKQIVKNNGFTFITKKNEFVTNDNYNMFGRYSVANTQGDFFAKEFNNYDELMKVLEEGVNAVLKHFDDIEKEYPLLCPLFPTFGGWVRYLPTEEPTTKCQLVIDPVSIYRELKHSLSMAKMYNQEAIFDFKIMDEIFLHEFNYNLI